MRRGPLLWGPVRNRTGRHGPKRGGPITVEHRVNEQIRAREVRLVGPEGEQVGVVPLERALQLAADVDLDMVEVAQMARHMEAANTALASSRRKRRLITRPRLLPSLRGGKARAGNP